MTATNINVHPIHLGLGATAEIEPDFTGAMEWYGGYSARDAAEVVLCTAGEITLHQEHVDGSTATVTIADGEYAINPPGTWHTTDVSGAATALFITAGEGTDHRPR